MFKPKQNFDEIVTLQKLAEYQEVPCRLTNRLSVLADSWSLVWRLRELTGQCDKTNSPSQLEKEKIVREIAFNLMRVINISAEFISPEKACDSNAININLRIITEMGWVSESLNTKINCFLNHYSNMENYFKEDLLPPQKWNLDALLNCAVTSFDYTFIKDLNAFETNSFNYAKSHIQNLSNQTLKTIIKEFYKAGSSLVFPSLGLLFFYSMRDYPELLGQIILVGFLVGVVFFKLWLKKNWKLLFCFYIPWIILFPIFDPQSVSETTNLYRTFAHVTCANLGLYFLFFSIEFFKIVYETAIEVSVLLSNKNHFFRSLFPFAAPLFVSSALLIISGIKPEDVPSVLFSSISVNFFFKMLFGIILGYFGYTLLTTQSNDFKPKHLHLIRSCFLIMRGYIILAVYLFVFNLTEHLNDFFYRGGFDVKKINEFIQSFAILFLFCVYSTYFYTWYKSFRERKAQDFKGTSANRFQA